MVVGPRGAGKTTLLTALGLMEQKHGGKTDMVSYTSRSIDTPGEMLENPRYYSVLLMNAPKAALVLFVADPTGNVRFPSRMAQAFRAPVLGVVTKVDVSTPEERERAKERLRSAGAREVVDCSPVTGEGMDRLKSSIERMSREVFRA